MPVGIRSLQIGITDCHGSSTLAMTIENLLDKFESENALSFFCHSEAAIAAVGIRCSAPGITDCRGQKCPLNDNRKPAR